MRRKIFAIGVFTLISLGVLAFFQRVWFFDGKLHIIFCDVGQGDAIYIRTPKAVDMLIDGGPDEKVLSCLADHMPFWDRTLDLVILTHPHADHLIGLISVIEQYKVISFVTEKLYNDTVSFAELKKTLVAKDIKTRYALAQERIRVSDGVLLDVVGPTASFLEATSPTGKIGESSEFASLVIKLSYKDQTVLFTGDSQASQLEESIGNGLGGVGVLQVPHHGSKTALTEDIIQTLYPKLAVISVGKNKYGHPNREIIGKLQQVKTKILRTDQTGNIELVSDGKKWEVR